MALTIKIDANAALRSASFGLGQIMGFNHKAAGYASPGDMVAAFCDDEAAGLEAMIRFIESEGLVDELRRHDWSAFARGYNGAGYAKHGYHTRLAAAFKRWQAVPDVLAPSYPKVRLGSRGAPVRVAQERLLALGFDPRGVDGIFGAGTRAAAIAFQFSAGLSQDRILGPRPGWPSSRSLYAYSTEDGHRFHGIVGSCSTPRAVWPTGAWSQARADRSSGFMVTARLRMLSPASGSRCAL